MVADQYKTYIPAGDQIIDVIPQEYTVDNIPNIIDPIGYTGVKVGALLFEIIVLSTVVTVLRESIPAVLSATW